MCVCVCVDRHLYNGYVLKIFNSKDVWEKSLDIVYLLHGAEFLQSWDIHLGVPPPNWFVITSNSFCDKMQSSFPPSRPSFSPIPVLLFMASAAFSQAPSLETLSHLLFASPCVPVSAAALTCFLLPIPTATAFVQAHLMTFTINV